MRQTNKQKRRFAQTNTETGEDADLGEIKHRYAVFVLYTFIKLHLFSFFFRDSLRVFALSVARATCRQVTAVQSSFFFFCNPQMPTIQEDSEAVGSL